MALLGDKDKVFHHLINSIQDQDTHDKVVTRIDTALHNKRPVKPNIKSYSEVQHSLIDRFPCIEAGQEAFLGVLAKRSRGPRLSAFSCRR